MRTEDVIPTIEIKEGDAYTSTHRQSCQSSCCTCMHESVMMLHINRSWEKQIKLTREKKIKTLSAIVDNETYLTMHTSCSRSGSRQVNQSLDDKKKKKWEKNCCDKCLNDVDSHAPPPPPRSLSLSSLRHLNISKKTLNLLHVGNTERELQKNIAARSIPSWYICAFKCIQYRWRWIKEWKNIY